MIPLTHLNGGSFGFIINFAKLQRAIFFCLMFSETIRPKNVKPNQVLQVFSFLLLYLSKSPPVPVLKLTLFRPKKAIRAI